MLIKMSTEKSIKEAATDLQTAVLAHRFGVMQIHNLKETMANKGVEFDHECLIFEVCQPQQAKRVLSQNMGISTALPCRISLFEENGRTFLATLKPTVLLEMFGTQEVEGVAREVEATLLKIMNEAAQVTR